ncbi:hypothetical protein P3G55_12685 [Leptospira sp. 96542]|nr:hypothetical protein [Leptospira sp. 96542]
MKQSLYIFILFFFVFCQAESNDKAFQIPQDDSEYLYHSNYKYDADNLPKIGDPEKLLYEKLGKPSGRYTFQKKHDHVINGVKFTFDKLFVYSSSRVERKQYEGFSSVENMEALDLNIFVLEGRVVKISIRNLIKVGEPRNQFDTLPWSQGPLDTHGKEFIVNGIFPNSGKVFDEYWKEQEELKKLQKTEDKPKEWKWKFWN